RLFVTSTYSSRSGWLSRKILRGPSRNGTKSPYCREQRVKNANASRRYSAKLPVNQCPGGPAGDFTELMLQVLVRQASEAFCRPQRPPFSRPIAASVGPTTRKCLRSVNFPLDYT